MGLDFIVLDSYHSEFKNIEMGQPVQRERELYELLAFIDEDGLLRVNGRLDAASWLPYSLTRSIILPPKHVLLQPPIKK